MTIGSKEHYEMIDTFKNNYNGSRLDMEEKEMWKAGQFFQHGETNEAFRMFSLGYSVGRSVYL